MTLTSGDKLVIAIYGIGTFNSFAVSDTQTNFYTQRIASITGSGSGASTYLWTASIASSGSDTITVSTGGPTRIYSASALQYRNVNSFGITAVEQNDAASSPGTSTLVYTSTSGDGGAVVEAWHIEPQGASASITYNNGQIQRDAPSGSSGSCTILNTCTAADFAVPVQTFSTSLSWSQTGGPCPCSESHSGLELLGTSTGTNPNLTQCYGNCGNPAVTYANTNSTHTTNFNNSLTLFYQWQAAVNGFVKNVTVNVAKTYSNGMQVQLALYSADRSCTTTQQPFTAACPGFINAVSPLFQNPAKGRLSFSTNNPTQNGQWFGIAVTANIAGLDLNDTNTNVQLYQTPGQIPGVITSASTSGTSKMALYAYVIGNSVITGPPPTVAGCNTVTCGLIAFWGALGGDAAAGIAVFLILFFLFFGLIFAFSRGTGVGLPVGPILLLLSIMSISLMVMLSAVGILPAYLPVLIIIIAAWLFTTKVLWSRHQGTGEPA